MSKHDAYREQKARPRSQQCKGPADEWYDKTHKPSHTHTVRDCKPQEQTYVFWEIALEHTSELRRVGTAVEEGVGKVIEAGDKIKQELIRQGNGDKEELLQQWGPE